MSVLMLLAIFVIWMSGGSDTLADGAAPHGQLALHAAIFLGGYAALVLWLGLQDLWLVRRTFRTGTFRLLRRANTLLTVAQLLIPVWFWVGVFQLDWPAVVARVLGPASRWPIEFPGLVLGVAPALLAWASLWWVHYPAYRALREQNLLVQFEREMPLYAPPGRMEYFTGRLRMQLLFAAVPVFTIIALRDAVGWMLTRTHLISARTAGEGVVHAVATIITYLLAPEMLRRVLATQSLPDEHLRERLNALSRRDGVRCRDVLLWRTHHTVGNAAVMGIISQVRYVLLSDLLLESLSDEQVLAVFAHELGHVVHRHLAWYAFFLLGFWVVLLGLGEPIMHALQAMGLSQDLLDQALPAVMVVGFVTIFGFISRRFERQADVHAARLMQAVGDVAEPATPATDPTFVGPQGAAIFNSALRRVSDVNNIPVEWQTRFTGPLRHRLAFVLEAVGRFAGSWVHGTMSARMRYISRLSGSPALTRRFDRQMIGLKLAMVLVVVGCGIRPALLLAKGPRHAPTLDSNALDAGLPSVQGSGFGTGLAANPAGVAR